MSRTVSRHDVVSFTYVIREKDGEVLEQSDLPMEYIHELDDRMWDKVAAALDGKVVGDSVEVTLNPDEGFGQVDAKLVLVEDIENVPSEFRHVGARPQFQNEHGDVREMQVTGVTEETVTIDGNHPFAGKTVTFIVSVLGIRDATEEEILQKQPMSAENNPVQ